MKNLIVGILILTTAAFVAALPLAAQQPPISDKNANDQSLEIKGNGNAKDAAQLEKIWLYPEDHLGQRIRLRGFLFEPDHFEYFPDHNGYLFSLEPLIYGRNNSMHAHIGNSHFVSHEKLNFFCTTADGQRIRRLFKSHANEVAIAADVELEVRKVNEIFFGHVLSFKPVKLPEPSAEVLP